MSAHFEHSGSHHRLRLGSPHFLGGMMNRRWNIFSGIIIGILAGYTFVVTLSMIRGGIHQQWASAAASESRKAMRSLRP